MKAPASIFRRSAANKGSALLMAVIAATIIAAGGAVTLSIIQSKARAIHQATAWKSSLLAAEAGVEMAMNEVRKNLYEPGEAWSGWTSRADDTLFPQASAPSGETSTAPYSMTSSILVHTGEGGQRSWARITVDAPASLVDRTGEQWYRIRSLGVSELPGSAIAAGSSEDVALRKFDLLYDRRTGNAITSPQAARLIETIVKPVGAFRMGLLGIESVDMTDHNIIVDSYDSSDDAKSTNGMYDPDKRQSNADVATNGTLINAGSAQIYGDALTNGGTVLNADNVHGEIRDDFYQEVFHVTQPNVTPEPGSPSIASSDTTLTAAPGSATNYVLSAITLAGSEILHIQGAADGSATYAQITVTGNIQVTGQAQIVIDPGVFLRVFVVGDADIAGLGIVNPNTPSHLQIYGVDRPTNPDGTIAEPGSIRISGNGNFSGAVYAPNYDITFDGGGTTGIVSGAMVGKSIRLTGVSNFHYDEALLGSGLISDYKIVSWYEDDN